MLSSGGNNAAPINAGVSGGIEGVLGAIKSFTFPASICRQLLICHHEQAFLPNLAI
jgi:hypothetical protein